MAWNVNISLVLILAMCGSIESLLFSPPLRTNQGFQRQSLVGYYNPRSWFHRRQHLFGNGAADRWLLHNKEEEGIENLYVYGTKRQLRYENAGSHALRKRHFGRGRAFKGHHHSLELFVRPQAPRRPHIVTKEATYDVPQIECPNSGDGLPRFACPSADRMGRYRCIDDHTLCDGFIDCPLGEDEDRQACMFYKMTKSQLNVVADAVLRWARGR